MKCFHIPKVCEAVQVNAVRYDGLSLSGQPFSEIPAWLAEAIREGRVRARPYQGNAVWEVGSGFSESPTASAGDWLVVEPRSTGAFIKSMKDEHFRKIYEYSPGMVAAIDACTKDPR